MNKSRTNSLIQDMNKSFLALRISLNPQQLNKLGSSQKLSQSLYLKSSSRHRKDLSFFSPQRIKPNKLSRQKQQAQHRYIKLTNLTKQQQTEKIWNKMNNKSHLNSEYKKIGHINITQAITKSKIFKKHSALQNHQVSFSHFHKTTKNITFNFYHVQYKAQVIYRLIIFIDPKKLQYISPNIVKYQNFPKRFSSILKQKQQFNQTFYLRESLFGKTDIDKKRDRVMDMYQLQKNPFKTPKSNQFIAKMKKQTNLHIDV